MSTDTTSHSMSTGMASESMQDSGTDSGHDHSGVTGDVDGFCGGSGVVMMNGWQASEGGNCITWLFEDAVVDTEGKYTLAVIGTFLLGFVNEMVRHFRDNVARDQMSFSPSLACGTGWAKDMVLTLLFAIQMFLAYALMLLVMTYEYVILIAIIVGLSVGHIVSTRLRRNSRGVAHASGGAAGKTPPEALPVTSGTPCCNHATSI